MSHYEGFTHLKFEPIVDQVLTDKMSDAASSLTPDSHTQLEQLWVAVDVDADVSCTIVPGEGRFFLRRGGRSPKWPIGGTGNSDISGPEFAGGNRGTHAKASAEVQFQVIGMTP